MKRLILIAIFIIFANCSYAAAQTVEVQQSFVDSASKAFSEVIADRAAIESLKTEIEARKNLESLNDQLIEKQKQIMGQQDSLIKTLTKQSQKRISFLFGLVRITY